MQNRKVSGIGLKPAPPTQGHDDGVSGEEAGLIASFLDEGEIDEFIVHVVPTFIGEGVPLVEARRRSVDLSLLSCRRFSDGVVRLHYRVLPPKKRPA